MVSVFKVRFVNETSCSLVTYFHSFVGLFLVVSKISLIQSLLFWFTFLSITMIRVTL